MRARGRRWGDPGPRGRVHDYFDQVYDFTTATRPNVVCPATLGFLALLFAALVLIPSGAHLAELPNKMDFSRDEYFIAQQIYRGWALFGVVILSALVCTLALTIKIRHVRSAFRLALTALVCLIAGQVIFWTFTFPANLATENWTVLPSNWADLRVRWEYSHAIAAVLNLAAFIALALGLLREAVSHRDGPSNHNHSPAAIRQIPETWSPINRVGSGVASRDPGRGRCTRITSATACPVGREHGLLDKNHPHAGDLPNVHVLGSGDLPSNIWCRE